MGTSHGGAGVIRGQVFLLYLTKELENIFPTYCKAFLVCVVETPHNPVSFSRASLNPKPQTVRQTHTARPQVPTDH